MLRSIFQKKKAHQLTLCSPMFLIFHLTRARKVSLFTNLKDLNRTYSRLVREKQFNHVGRLI